MKMRNVLAHKTKPLITVSGHSLLPDIDFDKLLDRTRPTFSQRPNIRRDIMTVDLSKSKCDKSANVPFYLMAS